MTHIYLNGITFQFCIISFKPGFIQHHTQLFRIVFPINQTDSAPQLARGVILVDYNNHTSTLGHLITPTTLSFHLTTHKPQSQTSFTGVTLHPIPTFIYQTLKLQNLSLKLRFRCVKGLELNHLEDHTLILS